MQTLIPIPAIITSVKKKTKGDPEWDQNSPHSTTFFDSNPNESKVDEYLSDTLDNYFSQEITTKNHCSYMSAQPELEPRHRQILIDWLFEIQAGFNFRIETMYLTFAIVDQYLGVRIVRKKYLQLVGVAALHLAGKYEESTKLPISTYARMTDYQYTVSQVAKAENGILNALQYRLSFPTIHHFLSVFLESSGSVNTVCEISRYLCERFLMEYGILKFLPSIVAASAICVARKTCGFPPWTCRMTRVTRYERHHLQLCINGMERSVSTRGQAQENMVDIKFRSPAFGCASLKTLQF